MSAALRVLAFVVVLLAPAAASAFGHRARAVSSASYYYYPTPWVVPEPMPVYWAAPVFAEPAPCTPAAAPLNYAVPTPAPATTTPPLVAPPAPPSTAPKPAVSETPATRTSYYAGPAGDTVTVSFWNYSDRDQILSVAGERRLLPRGKGVALDVPREFTWQGDGRGVQQERVPDGKTGLEIVLRR